VIIAKFIHAQLKTVREAVLKNRVQESELLIVACLDQIFEEIRLLNEELADLRHTARFGVLRKPVR